MSIRMESLEGAGEFNLNITICELSWRIIYNRDNHGNSAAAGSHVQGGSLILCYLWQRTSFLNFILIFHTMWTAWENVSHSFCKKLHYNYPPHISRTAGSRKHRADRGTSPAGSTALSPTWSGCTNATWWQFPRQTIKPLSINPMKYDLPISRGRSLWAQLRLSQLIYINLFWQEYVVWQWVRPPRWPPDTKWNIPPLLG